MKQEVSNIDGSHTTPLCSSDARRRSSRDLTENTYTYMERKDMVMETIQGRVETGLLTPLFEARLQYQSDKEGV